MRLRGGELGRGVETTASSMPVPDTCTQDLPPLNPVNIAGLKKPLPPIPPFNGLARPQAATRPPPFKGSVTKSQPQAAASSWSQPQAAASSSSNKMPMYVPMSAYDSARATRMEDREPQGHPMQDAVPHPRWEQKTGSWSPPGSPPSIDAGGGDSKKGNAQRMSQVLEHKIVSAAPAGLTRIDSVPMFKNEQGKRVNLKGERVDELGRLTRARGSKGPTSSLRWDHDWARVAREQKAKKEAKDKEEWDAWYNYRS